MGEAFPYTGAGDSAVAGVDSLTIVLGAAAQPAQNMRKLEIKGRIIGTPLRTQTGSSLVLPCYGTVQFASRFHYRIPV